MSEENVEAIIVKIIMDEGYRELLVSDPGKALEGYQLSAEESALFENLESAEFDVLLCELAMRVSRAGINLGINVGDYSTGRDKKIETLNHEDREGTATT